MCNDTQHKREVGCWVSDNIILCVIDFNLCLYLQNAENSSSRTDKNLDFLLTEVNNITNKLNDVLQKVC